MEKLIKISLLFLLSIIALASVVWFLQDIQTKSIKTKFETITTSIETDAEIWINQQGIAHITSSSDNGMFFAMGYFHASQRLWSMCHWRNIASGRIAEFHGERYIHCDMFMRALNLTKIAKNIYDNADSETKNALIAYTKGINEYIVKNKNKLSVEFISTNAVPEAWHPQDCFLLWRLWGFWNSNNFHQDLIMSDIVNRFNYKGLELIPQDPINSPHILDDTVRSFENNNLVKPVFINSEELVNHITNWNSNGYNNIFRTLKDVYMLLGRKSGNMGSTTWAVKKSEGDILLLTEMCSSYGLPSHWMQIHITSPTYNVVGMQLPGIPAVYTGRNDYIAWGQSNLNVDDVDFFVHKFKDKNNAEYLKSDSIYAKLSVSADTINVAKKDSYLYYKNIIDGYNVISDEMFALNKQNKDMNNNNLTFKWTGQIASNEIGSLLRVMRSKNWHEFLTATESWNNPGTTFSYADTRRNIGMAPRAFIPIRENGVTPLIANAYWKCNNGWQTIMKTGVLPVSYNPSKQFVVASNNTVATNLTHYIGASYAIDSRAKRLTEMLTTGDNYYYRYAQYIQNDVLSVYAREMWQNLRYIFIKYKHLLTDEELKAFYKLENWNYNMSKNSTSATIFSMFISKLLEKTFKDELKGLYNTYTFNSELPLMKLKELLYTPTSAWFDDISTPDRNEHLDFVVITSFKTTMAKLSSLYGTKNSDKWLYGKFHVTDFNPIFNYHFISKDVTSSRRVSASGGFGTINYQSWDLNNPFYITSGSSMRFVADMSNNVSYTTISGGVSGDVISPHYADQVQLWNIGAGISIHTNRKPLQQFKPFLRFHKNL